MELVFHVFVYFRHKVDVINVIQRIKINAQSKELPEVTENREVHYFETAETAAPANPLRKAGVKMNEWLSGLKK